MRNVALVISSLFLLLLSGCKSQKPVQQEVAAPAAPSWVTDRPLTDQYYIGIGSASKNQPLSDYQQSAKQNAINDLASEISVHISGTSFLYSSDINQRFHEEYNSLIKTATNQDIQGYSLVDTYDDGSRYWMYYRLSKQDYEAQLAARRQKAINLATQDYNNGKADINNHDIRGALNAYVRSMDDIKEFWGDDAQAQIDGKQVAVSNYLYNGLTSFMNSLKMVPSESRIELNAGNLFKTNVSVNFTAQNGQLPCANFPLTYQYYGQLMKVQQTLFTDGNGQAVVKIDQVDVQNPNNALEIKFDIWKVLSKELDNPFIRELITNCNVPQLNLPIDCKAPIVFYKSEENNFGTALGESPLANSLRERLQKLGFVFTGKPSEADLVLDISGNTRSAIGYQGFKAAALDYVINLKDAKTGELRYTTSRNNVKGVDLQQNGAGLNAWENAAKQDTRTIVNQIESAIY